MATAGYQGITDQSLAMTETLTVIIKAKWLKSISLWSFWCCRRWWGACVALATQNKDKKPKKQITYEQKLNDFAPAH